MTDVFRDSLQQALGSAFQLGRELGGGGMSRVFMARDNMLGRDVVVKVLSPELAQELSVERFGREIALAAALQHANIVPVLSAGVTSEGLPFYLMPFVDGASLRDRVTGGRSLPIADVLLVLTDVCRALVYAHGRGVVHRDIKPDNVMLSGGAALVTDFGIAKAMSTARTAPADSQLTRMGTSIGSPAYMAPEQGAGDPDTDHRADLYALGAMAYELLTGQPPFGDRPAHAQLVAHFSEAPVPVAERRTDVPEPLAQLVMQCLEKDPAHRPQQAAELLESLADASSVARLVSTGQYSAKVTGTLTAVAPAKSRRSLVVGGAAGLLALAAAGAWFMTREGGSEETEASASLVAVMPFAVRDASLNVWREGMVDILARSLDGVGTLRTVAPSTSIAKSPERADIATATALGKSLGAGLVVFGELSPLGKDSVQMRAALVDVARGVVRQDVNVRGELLRVDALADSLALKLLPVMGNGATAATRAALATMGTSSLPALKAYLQGQQYYRRGMSDSARLAYESAVVADSTFSLAWRGVASVYIRTGRESAPEAQAALDRAIRLRRGGSPRDSLLLHGDSLRLAVVRRSPVAEDALQDIPALTALFATLREATARYPSDAELWLELGDAGYHFGELAGVADTNILQDFERAIALDSMVLVPYVHAYNLALRTGKYRSAAAHVRRLAQLMPPAAAPYYGLLGTVLDSAPVLSRSAKAQLDSLPVSHAAFVLRELQLAPEATVLSLSVASSLSSRLTSAPALEDSAAAARVMLLAQAHRGKVVRSSMPLVFSDRVSLALVGLMPSDAVLQEARAMIGQKSPELAGAASLFAAARDTASVSAIGPLFDQIDAAARARGDERTRYAIVHRAYLALARGDSSAALRDLLSLPGTMCSGTPCAALITAKLLQRAGRDADAARVLDRALPSLAAQVNVPLLMQERAQLAERVGDKATARRWYERVLAQWVSGDAAVQPTVTAAKAGLARVR
ncbi:serine/threonine-protein kinase [Gemmatimonas sp.]|uniref:serine/threonine-protein kinase n=1 Tax=Gemmatimonas sp. TaxID=1962908 RepID=UPI00333E281A